MSTNAATLAQYRMLSEYKPQIGDFVIWSGWFTTWHGVVSGYDQRTSELLIIFAGVPFILFTMLESEYAKETRRIKLSTITGAVKGNWAIHQHAQAASVWYI